MGTRGFVGVAVDNQVKIAYQQFDSYPDGVGIETLRWLRDAIQDPAKLRAEAAKIRVVGEDDPVTPADIEKYGHLANTGVSSGKLTEWYVLLREQQGLLGRMFDEGIMLSAGASWPLDSLFCEWGYLVDFDGDGWFDVYQGFQESRPTEGRWAGRPTDEESAEDYRKHLEWCEKNGREPWQDPTPKYFAVQRVAHWPLVDLPTDELFFKTLNEEDDD